MGDIADDHADGTVCSGCGMFFKHFHKEKKPDELYTHGYPVLCWKCWNEWTPQERKRAGVQRALRPLL